MSEGSSSEATPGGRDLRAHGTLALLVFVDCAIAVAAFMGAYLARFEGMVPEPFLSNVGTVVIAALVAVPLVYAAFGLYEYVWRYVGVDMLIRLAGAVATLTVAGLTVVVVASRTIGYRAAPVGVVLIAAAFLFIGTATARALVRVSLFVRTRGGAAGGRRTLVAGAGDAGSLLLRDIETQPALGITVVGFVDDDPAKQRRSIRGRKVMGRIDDIPQLVAAKGIDQVLVAMPGVAHEERSRVLRKCVDADVPAKVVPSIARAASEVGVADLRDVQVGDLLGRESAPIDTETIRQTIEGRIVAVTGAAGSIGSELCRQLAACDPALLVLIEIDESRLYELFLELEESAPGLSEMRLCDIRDDRKLRDIFLETRPHLVLHAAAYKHVPLMELEPDEAVKTNVVGTVNVVEGCAAAGVDRFVLISTDKAVKPKSVMGATKSIAERLMLDACRRGMRGTAVRFGNVLGSRGSVVPLFEEQLRRGGPLRVTHPDVTRYFMTIPEAARLVLQAQALSDGGDIFVLDMGEPVRIVTLAQMMITLSGSDARIEFTGLRPAEKLHEILTTGTESLMPTGAPRIDRLSAVPSPGPRFADDIRALAVNARLTEADAIRHCIAELVPGFDPNESRVAQERAETAKGGVYDTEMETLL